MIGSFNALPNFLNKFSTRDTGSCFYAAYKEAKCNAKEMKRTLMWLREKHRKEVAVANVPKVAATCHNHSTTTSYANGCCKLCGGAC